MSNKIDVRILIKAHLDTLIYSGEKKKRNYWDILIFFVFPTLVSIYFVFKGWAINDGAISIFINLGAIFTTLLISVLVMMYDQHQKISDKIDSIEANKDIVYVRKYKNKRSIIEELFANISYSVVISVFVVSVSLIYQLLGQYHYVSKFILMPISIFLVINLLLTVLMVIKRTYLLMAN